MKIEKLVAPLKNYLWGGTKLKNSGMSTSITGKEQTIWEANGKYWLWRGDKNRYEEVDVSELQ